MRNSRQSLHREPVAVWEFCPRRVSPPFYQEPSLSARELALQPCGLNELASRCHEQYQGSGLRNIPDFVYPVGPEVVHLGRDLQEPDQAQSQSSVPCVGLPGPEQVGYHGKSNPESQCQPDSYEEVAQECRKLQEKACGRFRGDPLGAMMSGSLPMKPEKELKASTQSSVLLEREE